MNKPGALIYLPTKQKSACLYSHHSILKANGGTNVRFGPENVPPLPNTAFGHVVLVKQGPKYVLLISALQKNMEPIPTTKSKRRRREKETLFRVDPWQMSHGPTRHYALATAALKIASEMKKQGIEIEVHTPHPDATPEFMKETRERINRPFSVLDTHFETGNIRVFNDPNASEIKTINLSKPKTEQAHAALRRLRLG